MRFDAKQYAFFGKGVMEEIELGGLEDDNGVASAALSGLEEDYPFSAIGDREEVISYFERIGSQIPCFCFTFTSLTPLY